MLNRVSKQFPKDKPTLLILGGSLFTLLFFWLHNASYFWIEAWFMVEIAVVTHWTRRVKLLDGLAIYAQGVAVSGLGTIIIWNMLNNVIGINNTAGGQVIMGIVEEIMKLLPVLWAARMLYTRTGKTFNGSDWLFLAVWCAAGFSMLEKYFWQGVYFPFTYGPHLGNIYFFPDALGNYVSGEPFGYIGHSAAAGLIAMAIWFGFYAKKKYAIADQRWFIIPGAALLWILLEHIFSNMYYINRSDALLSLGGGMLTPWLFMLLLIFTLTIGWKERNLKTTT